MEKKIIRKKSRNIAGQNLCLHIYGNLVMGLQAVTLLEFSRIHFFFPHFFFALLTSQKWLLKKRLITDAITISDNKLINLNGKL